MFLDLEKKPSNKIAIKDDKGDEITYGQIIELGQSFYNAINHRTMIFIKCINSVGAALGYLSALSNHIVPLLISNNIDRDLLNNLINTYQPEYIWEPIFNTTAQDVIFEAYDYKLVNTGYPAVQMHDSLSMLLTTSGSTGSPKLVRHSYNNLESQGRHISEFFELTTDDRALADLPIHYTMGLSVLTSFLYAGASCYLTGYNVLDPEYWDFWKTNKITVFTNIPYTYEILSKMKFFKMDLPNLRIITQGGGKLKDELYVKCADYASNTNRKFIPTYGQTEGTARMAYLPAELVHQKIGCIGKAIPGGKLYLKDENGNIIDKPDVSGEMFYEGPNVTMGYAEKKEDLLLGDERKGVLPTGDLARMDNDGYFYIVGRLSRFLKLAGHRVGLDECERIINSRFEITSACSGNDSALVIFVTEDCHVDEIQRYISEKLKLNMNLIRVIVIDSIPRNEAGKILYKELNSLM